MRPGKPLVILGSMLLAISTGCRPPAAESTPGTELASAGPGGAAEVPGADTPPAPGLAGAKRLSLGEPAPDFGIPVFQLPSITPVAAEEERFHLADFAGRPLILNFWATWCAPCVAELPLLEAAAAEHRAAGLAVLAVDLRESREVVAAFLDQRRLDLPVGLDTAGESAYLYRVRSLPTSVFIDREGRVVDLKVGAFRGAADLDQSLTQILP